MKLGCPNLTVLFSSVFFILLLGCGAPGPPLAPSLELPKVVTDLRATRKGDKVYLAWTVPSHTTDLQTVRRLGWTVVCRSLEVAFNQCDTPVTRLPASQFPIRPNKGGAPVSVIGSYQDTLPSGLGQQDPRGMINYAVEVQNQAERSAGLSNEVAVPVAPTLPAPRNLEAEVTSEGVVLHWTGTLPARDRADIRYLYRVYRRQKAGNDVVAGETPLGGTPEASLTDHGFQWEQNYEYRVTAVSVLSLGGEPWHEVEGDDSSPLGVFTKDVFPPAVPGGLEAVYSGVGQQPFIDLTWAPVTDSDLAGYNVYRHQGGAQPIRINTSLLTTPAFRDSKVEPGHSYFYSVSAIDLRGNESAHSEEVSESAP